MPALAISSVEVIPAFHLMKPEPPALLSGTEQHGEHFLAWVYGAVLSIADHELRLLPAAT